MFFNWSNSSSLKTLLWILFAYSGTPADGAVRRGPGDTLTQSLSTKEPGEANYNLLK